MCILPCTSVCLSSALRLPIHPRFVVVEMLSAVEITFRLNRNRCKYFLVPPRGFFTQLKYPLAMSGFKGQVVFAEDYFGLSLFHLETKAIFNLFGSKRVKTGKGIR